MKSSTTKIIIVLASSVITLVLATFAIIYLPNRLIEQIEVEAGEITSLNESMFLKTSEDGKFSSEVNEIDLSIPGSYTVKMKVGWMVYRSTLIIKDTHPPQVKVKEIVAALKSDIQPEDFIEEAIDNTTLSYKFINEPNSNELGLQQVTIAITDLGGNIIIKRTNVLVSQVKDKVVMEAGSEVPTLEDFLIEEKTNEVLITNLKDLNLVVGVYPVEIQMGNRVLTCELEVVDTVAPKATLHTVRAFVNDEVEAKDFIKSVEDESKVLVSFKDAVNPTKQAGTFSLTIVLTDAGNNVSEYTGEIVVKEDKEAPILSGSGLVDKTVYVNEGFNLKNNVTAYDNRDGKVQVVVDRTVDFTVEGSTTVTYSAKDRAGNVARKSVVITVINHPPFVPKASTNNGALDQVIDELFSTLLHGDMSAYQITEALYRFGRSWRYQAGPLASEWTSRALSTLQTRTGNCFGKMYAMKALYTRAGIPNREQIQYNQEHSWNQVNIGSGWLNVDVGYGSAFLVTDAYLKERALRYSSIDDDTWETQAPVVASVIVKYVDVSTNVSIAEQITMQSNVGDAYQSSAKTIEGYVLVKTPTNANGVYQKETVVVVYEYEARPS